MKRTCTVIALLLTLCLVASFMPLMSSAAEVSTWDGTSKGSLKQVNGGYAITSAADLAFFAEKVNSGYSFVGETVYLTTDIKWNDTTNVASWTASTTGLNPWTPIGQWGKEFRGTFDGQGHTISGLWAAPTAQNFGVFGVTYDTVIKNLKITDSKFFFSQANSGGLVAIHRMYDLTVENVYNDIDIEATSQYLGGFVGTFHANGIVTPTEHNMTFKNCVYAGTFKSTNTYVGGFLGNYTAYNADKAKDVLLNLTFTDCLMSGSVTGKAAAGSFLGGAQTAAQASGDGLKLTMTDCMVTGTVTEATGGWGNVGNVFASADTSKNTSALNNVWYLDSLNKDTFANSYKTKAGVDLKATNATNVVEKLAADFTALSNTTLASNGFENWEKTTAGVMPKMAVTPMAEVTVPVKDVAPATDASKYAGTASTTLRTEGTTVYIDSAADLAKFAQNVTDGTDNYAGKTVVLTKDIIWNEGDASTWFMNSSAPKYTWVCGAWGKCFKGTFDGQGHVISGIYGQSQAGANKDNVGFFNTGDGNVTVKNLSIVNSLFSTTSTAGANLGGLFGVVGYDTTKAAVVTIDNVLVDAYCSAPLATSVGGLIGRVHLGSATVTIKNSVFAGYAVGKQFVGGLVGQAAKNAAASDTKSADITITDSANYGLVYSTSNSPISTETAQVVGVNDDGATTMTNVIAAGYAYNNGKLAPAFLGKGVKNVTLKSCLIEKDHASAASGVASTTALTGYTEIETAALLGKVPTGFTNWEAQANSLPMPKAPAEGGNQGGNEGGNEGGNQGGNEGGQGGSDTDKNPGTSDWVAPSMILAIMAVATGAAVVLRKKVSE